MAAVLLRWRIEGADHLPSHGPVLLAINHLSALDPLLGGSAVRRKVHFMAKEELFRSKFLAAVLRRLGAFPVRRGESDRQALRQAVRLLEQGEVVGIFPEGTRSPDGRLQQAQTGLAFLAQRTGAVVVPMAILGTRDLFSHRTRSSRPAGVRIVVGEPLHAPGEDGGDSVHERHRRFADEVMGRINALLSQTLERYSHWR